MSVQRSVILGLGFAVVIAGTMLEITGQTQSLPGAPMSNRQTLVTPRLEGWYRNPDGTATILAGYFNRNANIVDVPIGPNNRIEPQGPDQGQPTRFLPGRQWGMFSITVPKDFGHKKFTWTIVANNQPATITLWMNPPYIVSPFISEFDGNTPPVAKFDPAGPELKGPSRGIAKTYTATVGTPLTLTLWAKDAPPTLSEGGRGPGPGGGGAPGAGRGPAPSVVRVSWATFRGPSEAKFANVRPPVDQAADGKAETTVTFDRAGEYWLRAQFNDSSGEGGGGDQCCWTSALVKVIVK